jgi:hypothetical protein
MKVNDTPDRTIFLVRNMWEIIKRVKRQTSLAE